MDALGADALAAGAATGSLFLTFNGHRSAISTFNPISPEGFFMTAVQDILVLFQTTPALDAQVVAWARYEASKGTGLGDLVEESDPPYHNAMAALRDGWQVIQMSELKHRSPQEGYELGPLPYQIVLSKFNELQKEEGATS